MHTSTSNCRSLICIFELLCYFSPSTFKLNPFVVKAYIYRLSNTFATSHNGSKQQKTLKYEHKNNSKTKHISHKNDKYDGAVSLSQPQAVGRRKCNFRIFYRCKENAKMYSVGQLAFIHTYFGLRGATRLRLTFKCPKAS